ncbi:MAG: glycosyltransferase family 2 protein [PVC group bacterium]|nr:glycosyltransferase family 2 protein [PVC group bacterium]
MQNPLVSIIIVNWNGLAHLKKCFVSLKGINYKNYEIILVDNNSKDESVAYVREKFPKVKIIVNTENLGFAEANNIGYENSKGDLILFLNNDVEIEPDFLGILVQELIGDPNLGGVQPKILLMKEREKLDSVGGFLTNSGFLYHYGIYKDEKQDKYNKKIDIYSAKGACMLFRKKVIEKTGLFDKDFFAYFEETDFCHRVWLAGYKIRYVPESRIYHLMGGTSGAMDSPLIQFHSFKNRINSFLKNLGIKELMKILLHHLILINLVSIVCLFCGKIKMAFAIQKAIYWNFLNIHKTVRKRKIIQKNIRMVSGHEIEKFIMQKPRLIYYFYLFANKVPQYNDPVL